MKGGKATGQTRAAPYAQQSSFTDLMGKGSMNMPQGDWNCPSCGDMQFERNSTCRMCGTPKPVSGQGAAGGGMANAFGGAMTGGSGKGFIAGLQTPGDWLCPSCGDHQFSRNSTCRQCGTAKPESAGKGGGGMANFGGAMTGGSGKGFISGLHSPGDWLCPSCGDHQFSRNSSCRKCGAAKPQEAGTPRVSGNNFASEKELTGSWEGFRGVLAPRAAVKKHMPVKGSIESPEALHDTQAPSLMDLDAAEDSLPTSTNPQEAPEAETYRRAPEDLIWFG